MRLRLGSRGSALALWQARHVSGLLQAAWPGLEVAVTIIKTEGDRHLDAPLAASGGKGVFVKEIEDALLAGTIDVAVHSLKDLPTEMPPGLTIAAVPARHDPRDALVAAGATKISDLPRGARVGTGSPRRRCQLLAARPDLRCLDVRGNVDTRLAKLARGEFDALVLAVAGIERLGIADAPYTPIPVATCLPAPGQGALAIETRADDPETRRLAAVLDDQDVAGCVRAERAFLEVLGAGCLAPAAALATHTDGMLSVEGMVGEPDGTRVKRAVVSGDAADAIRLGRAVALQLT